jgi:hypothetical protein
MKRILAAVVLIPMACVTVFAQKANEQKETTSPQAAGPVSHAERLSAKGQELMKEWFRLPSLQNPTSQLRRSSVDAFFIVSRQEDTTPKLVLFEGRIYVVAGEVAGPLVGGGWCWDSSDLQERMARLREHLSQQGPSWPPLPRK